MAKRYSEWEKHRAISLASEIGVAEASRRLGIPVGTLRNWGAKGPEQHRLTRFATQSKRNTRRSVSTSGSQNSNNTSKTEEKTSFSRGDIILLIGLGIFVLGVCLFFLAQILTALVCLVVGFFIMYMGFKLDQKEKAKFPPSEDTTAKAENKSSGRSAQTPISEQKANTVPISDRHERTAVTQESTSTPPVQEEKPIPVIFQRQKEFELALDGLKRAAIGTDGKKTKNTPSVPASELKYSNITTRTNFSKLGDFVVVDTETTGLSASRDKIIELSAIRFEGFEPVEVFETLINPGKEISPAAQAVNHITTEMVQNAPYIWQVMPSFNAFINGYSIVGHNLPFDLKFLLKAGLQLGEKQRLFDTLELAKRTIKKGRRVWDKELHCYLDEYEAFEEVPNYKLGTLCQFYLICDHCDHRASGDALATGYLFQALAEVRTKKV